MALELWAQCDLYGTTQHGNQQRKGPKDDRLHNFLCEADPGEKLFRCIDKVDPVVKQNLPERMIRKCLHENPRDRYSIREWINELSEFNRENHHFAQ